MNDTTELCPHRDRCWSELTGAPGKRPNFCGYENTSAGQPIFPRCPRLHRYDTGVPDTNPEATPPTVAQLETER